MLQQVNATVDTCQRRNQTDGTCTRCVDGVRGPTCALCQNAAGCKVLRPDLNSPICDQNITYSADTLVKTYSCDGSNILGGGIVAPGIAFQCNRCDLFHRVSLAIASLEADVSVGHAMQSTTFGVA